MASRRLLTTLAVFYAICASHGEARAEEGEWENPKEVYGADWDCSRMQVGNPTFDMCRRCEAGGGTFQWKRPVGATQFDPRLEYYRGNCQDSAASKPGSAPSSESGTDNEEGNETSPTPPLIKQSPTSQPRVVKGPASSNGSLPVKICNGTDLPVSLSIATSLDAVEFKVSGWFSIGPQTCRDLGEQPKDGFYYYAQSKEKKWPSNRNNTSVRLCAPKSAYHRSANALTDARNCPSDMKAYGFNQFVLEGQMQNVGRLK